MYHHANFTVIGVAVDEISVTGPADREKTATNIPFHTNVWQVIATSECWKRSCICHVSEKCVLVWHISLWLIVQPIIHWSC